MQGLLGGKAELPLRQRLGAGGPHCGCLLRLPDQEEVVASGRSLLFADSGPCGVL